MNSLKRRGTNGEIKKRKEKGGQGRTEIKHPLPHPPCNQWHFIFWEWPVPFMMSVQPPLHLDGYTRATSLHPSLVGLCLRLPFLLLIYMFYTCSFCCRYSVLFIPFVHNVNDTTRFSYFLFFQFCLFGVSILRVVHVCFWSLMYHFSSCLFFVNIDINNQCKSSHEYTDTIFRGFVFIYLHSDIFLLKIHWSSV